MKGCLIILGIFAAIVAIFAGVMWFLASNDEDQSSLTSTYQAEVVSADARADRYDVVYSYEAGGTTYYGTEWFYKKNFNPGAGLHVCADPDSPARHAPSISKDCGASSLSGGTRTGKTTPPGK